MPARASLRSTLAQPNYGIYLAGNSVSLVGNWMQRTATGWLAWELTHQSFWVGAVVLADLVPTLIVGPFGGVLADRVDRRRIMMETQSALCIIVAAMTALAAVGGMGLWALIGFVALNGTVVGVNQPARLALIPMLVDRHHLPTAIAVNSITFNAARFVGPAIAGLLIAAYGVPAAFFGNAVSYIAFIISLILMRLPYTPSTGDHGRVFAEIAEGIRYVASHLAIGPLFLLFIGTALTVRPLGELLPGLADQVFAGGPEALALLSSTMGLGAVIGGVVVMRTEPREQVAVALGGALGAAITSACVAIAPSLHLAMVAVAGFGAALLVAGVAAQTVMQMAAPPQLRGRVMSLFGLVFRGGPAIGAVSMGWFADTWGLRVALLGGACLMIVLWLPISAKRRQIARALAEGSDD
jgi:MFS family permease